LVIDIHTHCFPDHIASKALDALAAVAANHPRFTDGTIAGLKESMRQSGISKSVILHIATKASQTSVINRWAVEINDDEIISFGTIHPDYSDWKDEIAFLSDAKIKGIKFHPDYQGFFIDEPRMFPVYEAIAKAGMIILFHAGLDIGLPGPYKCMPYMLKKITRDLPGAKIIAAHMGAYAFWDDVDKLLLGEELYFDTSYCLVKMEQERLKSMIINHGYEKVLFGSDSPWAMQNPEIEKIRALGLTDMQTEAVLYGNSRRLLGI